MYNILLDSTTNIYDRFLINKPIIFFITHLQEVVNDKSKYKKDYNFGKLLINIYYCTMILIILLYCLFVSSVNCNH